MEALIEFWKLISAPVMGIIAWWNIMLHNKIEQNTKDIAEYKTHVAENYAKNDQIARVMDEVKYVRDGVDEIKVMLMKGKK